MPPPSTWLTTSSDARGRVAAWHAPEAEGQVGLLRRRALHDSGRRRPGRRTPLGQLAAGGRP